MSTQRIMTIGGAVVTNAGEKVEAIRQNGIYYIEVSGTPYEMGKQHGVALKDQIIIFMSQVDTTLCASGIDTPSIEQVLKPGLMTSKTWKYANFSRFSFFYDTRAACERIT